MNNVFLDAVIESQTVPPTATVRPDSPAEQPSSFPTLMVAGVALLVVLAVVLIFRARRK